MYCHTFYDFVLAAEQTPQTNTALSPEMEIYNEYLKQKAADKAAQEEQALQKKEASTENEKNANSTNLPVLVLFGIVYILFIIALMLSIALLWKNLVKKDRYRIG